MWREGLAPPSCQSSAPHAEEHPLPGNRAGKLNRHTPQRRVGMPQRGRSASTHTPMPLPHPCAHPIPKGLPGVMLFREEHQSHFPSM